ncbi:MAG: HEAT repeat domain-containing protein [Planctomycetes bacterium]|nr:HEAT repeat domain-containing protein [Planctomycetota bacterium]
MPQVFPLLLALWVTPAGGENPAAWVQSLEGRIPDAAAIVEALADGGAASAAALERALPEDALQRWGAALAAVPAHCAALTEGTGGTPSSDRALREFGLACATRFGTETCVEPLFRLCEGLPSSSDADAPAVVDAGAARFAQVLEALAPRAPKALAARTLRQLPHAWLAPTAEACGRTGLQEGVAFLLAQLEGDPSLEPTALTALARVARRRSAALELGDAGLRRVQFCLSSAHASTRAAAAQALGQLDAVRAVPELVDALRDPQAAVQAAALGALQTLTDLRMGLHPRAWTSWLADQDAWWEAHGARVLRDLANAQGADLTQALRLASTARLHRRDLAPALVALLDTHEVDQLRGALAALEALRPARARVAVEALRAHPDSEVAHRATRLAARLGSPPLPATRS